MELITSKSNPKIKIVRSLYNTEKRRASGLFLVEGIKHVGESYEAFASGLGWQFEAIFYAPDILESTFALSIVDKFKQHHFPCYAVSQNVFTSIAGKDNPQGIMAVVKQPRINLLDIKPTNFIWGVALVRPQDPGNIGAIIRTIDAVGASGLILLDGGADPFHPNCVRASMGSIFWYPIIQASIHDFSTWITTNDYLLLGTSAKAELDYKQIDLLQRPIILLLGSEREGLSQEYQQICNHIIRLPMKGRTTSLNLAVAASVFLYQMIDNLENPDRL